jgi:hypothetical protein
MAWSYPTVDIIRSNGIFILSKSRKKVVSKSDKVVVVVLSKKEEM